MKEESLEGKYGFEYVEKKITEYRVNIKDFSKEGVDYRVYLTIDIFPERKQIDIWGHNIYYLNQVELEKLNKYVSEMKESLWNGKCKNYRITLAELGGTVVDKF